MKRMGYFIVVIGALFVLGRCASNAPKEACNQEHVGHDGHKHGANCGHAAVEHEGHTDYTHDGHHHAAHGEHYDDHTVAAAACTKIEKHPHKHKKGCGHKTVKHDDHMDYLHGNQTHCPHDDHYDLRNS